MKRSSGAKVDCQDVHRLLFEYAQGALEPKLARRLGAHLADCPPCLDFVETYRQTIIVTRRCCRANVTLPRELERKLKEFVEREL